MAILRSRFSPPDRRCRWSGALALLTLLLPCPARAAVYQIDPGDSLQAAIDLLLPGDQLVLEGGTYVLSSRLSVAVTGTPLQPIVIRAAAGEVAELHYPSAAQNVINVESAAHLVLRGLEVTGGSHGIRIAASSFVTIEDCHVHDVGDVGISANVPGSVYSGLRIRRNHIHHTNNTGEGMYLGCNSNGCQLANSLIEGNYVHHTNGPSVSQGDGIEIKEGSWGNVVRDNVIHDTNYPCILTYSTAGNGPPNVIERNLLFNCGDHAIQTAADAIVRNNVILGAAGDGIRSQPHQAGTPANLVVVHNTVLSAGANAFRASGITGSLVLANNVFHAPNGYAISLDGTLSGVVVSANLGAGALLNVAGGFTGAGTLAGDFVAASMSGAPPQDLFPATGGRLVGGGDDAWAAPVDWNVRPRRGSVDAGAYEWQTGGNPGWALQAAMKPLPWLFADDFDGGNVAAWSSAEP